MADIDIFSLTPSVVTRDLSSKSFLLYGARKSGKTSNAVKFPKPLLIACERGYNMLSGVIAQPVNKWTEMIKVKKQLLQRAQEIKDWNEENPGNPKENPFKTVIVDTADIAYVYCEKHILQLEGVDHLDETVQMRGYKEVKREFDSFFQDIVKAGYTLVAISHSTSVQVKENGEKYDKTLPTIDKRGYEVLAGLVDVIGYSTSEVNEEGKTHSVLYMRGSKSLEAGSRNKYMSEKIPFTYDALLADMIQAIDKLEADGATVVDSPINVFVDPTDEVDFDATMNSIKKIALACRDCGKTEKYQEIVFARLGKNKNVRDCTRDQADILDLMLIELRDMCKLNEIEVEV